MKDFKEIAQRIAKVIETLLMEEFQEVDSLEETMPYQDDYLEESGDNGLATVDDMEDFIPLDLSEKLKQ